ncbi:MAG TPA: hypothetical protein VG206_26675 [Terriglobia bacterium]|nr:hypothetical protein [Terriglobia bacterium]
MTDDQKKLVKSNVAADIAMWTQKLKTARDLVVSLTLDQTSLSDAHQKADGALAATRDLDKRVSAQEGTTGRHAGLIRELGSEKADQAAHDALRGRFAALEAELSNRPMKADLEALDQKLSERIRLALNLGELLPK